MMGRLPLFLAVCVQVFMVNSLEMSETSGEVKPIENGECVCHVHTNPSHADLVDVRSSLEELSTRLHLLENLKLDHKIKHLGRRLQHLTHNMHNQTLQLSFTELLALQDLYDSLAVLVTDTDAVNQTLDLRAQVAELHKRLGSLWESNPSVRLTELQGMMEILEQKVATFEQQTFSGNVFSFPGDNQPLRRESDKEWCLTHEVEAIGEPVIHKYEKTVQWMKDPYPESLDTRAHIYMGAFYSPGPHTWHHYTSYINLLSTTQPSTVNQHLTHGKSIGLDWNSYVVYKGYIYSFYINSVKRYKIGTTLKKSTAWYNLGNVLKSFPYKDKGKKFQTSPVELMVDELGLWAVYTTGNSGGRLVITSMDSNYTKVGSTHLTNKPRSAVCKSFMVCGRLYTIEQCGEAFQSGKTFPQYLYNTTDDHEYFLPLFARSVFGSITSLAYNPRERMLFAVDHYHLVTYPIKWRNIPAK